MNFSSDVSMTESNLVSETEYSSDVSGSEEYCIYG